MTELQKAEKDFIMWLDNVNCSGVDDVRHHHKCIYYRLIEGMRDNVLHSVSFHIDRQTGQPKISSRAIYPRSPQVYTIEQFYEWMSKPNKTSFLQQF